MSYLFNLDYALTNFFNQLIPHNVFFNYLFSFFSLKAIFVVAWLLVVIISRKKRFIILFSLSLLLTFLFGDLILKNIFMRHRPIPILSCPIDFSFPSGHASVAFAAATILAYFDKNRRWFYYLFAVLISYSRIYLGCHYFFDVIGGALVGYLISQLLLFAPDTFPSRRKN